MSYASIEEALVVQALLCANDVPAVLDNYHHASNDWYLTQALGGVRVLVPANELVRTKNILIEHYQNARIVLDSAFENLQHEKLPTRYKRAWSMAFIFFGAPQFFIIIAVITMTYIAPKMMWGGQTGDNAASEPVENIENVQMTRSEAVMQPPPPPPPPPVQHYATARSAILPSIDGFLAYVLLLSAFANFERPEQNGEAHDPSRPL